MIINLLSFVLMITIVFIVMTLFAVVLAIASESNSDQRASALQHAKMYFKLCIACGVLSSLLYFV